MFEKLRSYALRAALATEALCVRAKRQAWVLLLVVGVAAPLHARAWQAEKSNAELQAQINRIQQIVTDVAEVQIKGFGALGAHHYQLGVIGGLHPSQFTSHGAPTEAEQPWLPDPLAGKFATRK